MPSCKKRTFSCLLRSLVFGRSHACYPFEELREERTDWESSVRLIFGISTDCCVSANTFASRITDWLIHCITVCPLASRITVLR